MGWKTPHINTIKILITVAGGIAWGISRKGVAKKTPKLEAINEENKMAMKYTKRFTDKEKENERISTAKE